MKARGNESFFREYLHILLHVHVFEVYCLLIITKRNAQIFCYFKRKKIINMKKCMFM